MTDKNTIKVNDLLDFIGESYQNNWDDNDVIMDNNELYRLRITACESMIDMLEHNIKWNDKGIPDLYKSKLGKYESTIRDDLETITFLQFQKEVSSKFIDDLKYMIKELEGLIDDKKT